MLDPIAKLNYARQAELAVQCELEHIERLHRIMRLPGRPLEYVRGIADKLTALEKRLNHTIDCAIDRKNEALDLLDRLSGDERTVLYRYYILGESWQKVAEQTYLCERSVYTFRKKALDKLEAFGEDEPHNADGAQLTMHNI